ncbi:hypothetical protein Xind_00622 [Xenorhabdus indica]|nr:hypothetical protein [Xenorhabdus indica]
MNSIPFKSDTKIVVKHNLEKEPPAHNMSGDIN